MRQPSPRPRRKAPEGARLKLFLWALQTVMSDESHGLMHDAGAMEQTGILFDQTLREKRRARSSKTLPGASFLHQHAATIIADRLNDMARSFEAGLCINAAGGYVADAVAPQKVGHWVSLDPVPAMLPRTGLRLSARAEQLPIDAPHFDLVVSFLDLHHLNDVPGALIQANRVLRPDGLFLAITFGGATLSALRSALLEAEMEVAGGAGPRVSPMADLRDYGALLQRAGFALPVTDVDRITVRHAGLWPLLHDLRAMGETCPLALAKRRFLSPYVLMRADALLRAREGDADGRIRTVFELVTLTAWAPHESQQKPLRPGSARHSLAKALGAREQSAGEKAGN